MPEQPSTRKAELVDSELYSQYRDCDRWAVIVGVSKYQYPNLTLRYAERDAEELHKLLLTPNGGGFQPDHICKLTNEQATTRNITGALRSFLKKPAREDLVLIYFACHGSPDPDRPGNVYLLTYDTDPNDIAGTALPMETIDQALKGNLHSEKVIILADTCHSAAIGGGIGGRRSVVDDSKLMNRFLQDISQSKGGVALLTSAEANEVSFEDAKWGGGHGVFTHYLLEGMRGAADFDGNGIVTIGELFEYVRDNVKKSTEYRQHPSIGTNAYDRNLPVTIAPYANFSTISRDYQSQYNPNELHAPIKTGGNFEKSSELLLASECDIDYSSLLKLLVGKKWEAANKETTCLLIKASGREFFGAIDRGREGIGTLGDRDILDLPCQDLLTIDRLWVKYSNGRFGFSVQSEIYQKVRDWDSFLEEVGWFSEREIVFALSSPKGHLPTPPKHYTVGRFWHNVATIVDRLEKCKGRGAGSN